MIMTFKTCSYLLLSKEQSSRVQNDDIRVTAGNLDIFKVKLILSLVEHMSYTFCIAKYLNDLDIKVLSSEYNFLKTSFHL